MTRIQFTVALGPVRSKNKSAPPFTPPAKPSLPSGRQVRRTTVKLPQTMHPARPLPEAVIKRITSRMVIHSGAEHKVSVTNKVKQCVTERRWLALSVLGPRSYGWPLFRSVKPYLSDDEYWRFLRDTYDETETAWQQGDIARLFHARRGQREAMMNPTERAQLADLPPIVHILRGCHEVNREGWAWTLSRKTARSFALRDTTTVSVHGRVIEWRRPAPTGLVRHGSIDRARIIAFLNVRNEEEVVCDPADVRVSREQRVCASDIP